MHLENVPGQKDFWINSSLYFSCQKLTLAVVYIMNQLTAITMKENCQRMNMPTSSLPPLIYLATFFSTKNAKIGWKVWHNHWINHFLPLVSLWRPLQWHAWKHQWYLLSRQTVWGLGLVYCPQGCPTGAEITQESY